MFYSKNEIEEDLLNNGDVKSANDYKEISDNVKQEESVVIL